MSAVKILFLFVTYASWFAHAVCRLFFFYSMQFVSWMENLWKEKLEFVHSQWEELISMYNDAQFSIIHIELGICRWNGGIYTFTDCSFVKDLRNVDGNGNAIWEFFIHISLIFSFFSDWMAFGGILRIFLMLRVWLLVKIYLILLLANFLHWKIVNPQNNSNNQHN